ncbi:lauroyl/myristoyl acyltransferase [Marmoricola sp. OAE513]|uniref:hypothetical protein n=1 Tax=Marmoricola sp. OAE513 TaxID=2817894 RepID=UPI001AE3599B
MGFLGDTAKQLPRFLPWRSLQGIARRRVDGFWGNDQFRAVQEENMHFLLEYTDRVHEVPQIAREYAEFDVLRNYRRWHPKHLSRQPVEDVEKFLEARSRGRGVIISFVHHGQYNGVVSSMARVADDLAGVPKSERPGFIVNGVVSPEAFDKKAPLALRQHFKVCAYGPNIKLMSATDGTGPMIEILENGGVLAIAFDVAGRTPIKFLGRDMLGSFGMARLAVQTNVPVVIISSHKGADGLPYGRVHDAIEPSDFPDPADLLAEIIRRHEPAILEWPAAYDSPHSRLGVAKAENQA